MLRANRRTAATTPPIGALYASGEEHKRKNGVALGRLYFLEEAETAPPKSAPGSLAAARMGGETAEGAA